MYFARREGRTRVAVLTATLMFPSLAHADSIAEPPAAEAEATEAPATEEAAPSTDEAPSSDDDLPGDVINPDLAAEALKPDWEREGYGTGTGVAGPEVDPRALNKKIRTAGRVTLAGGAIAVLGGVLALSGAGILFIGKPESRLNKLAADNGGNLPVDNAKRHQLISLAKAGPIVAFTGLGVLVAGVVTAAVGRIRLKKLREQRRTSAVAFVPTQLGRGAMVHWEMKF